jgi:hypothetical protein
MQEFKIGDTVKWCWSELHKNTYIIIDINKLGAVLKQNFSTGVILNGRVSLSELEGI